MKAEFIPKVITLLAGAVVCIVAIVKQMDVTYSLEVLLCDIDRLLYYWDHCTKNYFESGAE